MDADILIIGAGVAGLFAARNLSAAGKKVIILEARDRPGGRIQTLYDPSFELPVEMGAEFVHGDLELTIQLLREAGLKHYAISGDKRSLAIPIGYIFKKHSCFGRRTGILPCYKLDKRSFYQRRLCL